MILCLITFAHMPSVDMLIGFRSQTCDFFSYGRISLMSSHFYTNTKHSDNKQNKQQKNACV